MTTIRKIVTSKIDGSDANNNDTNEIRPFGETSFYVDGNGPTDKLVLSIHDGVRTHLKSKVLAPGVLYGSNADSGDGAGLDTIKLIPDVEIYNNFGSEQYIIIDPTAPNHVHIRAGGTIDNSNADLFLGGELTHVKVSDGYDNVVIRTSTVGEGITEHNWTFGADGGLSLPNGITVLGNSSSLTITPDDNLEINTGRYPSLTEICAISNGAEFVADIEFNDDITVVQAGWTTTIDSITYTVTSIDPAPPANQFRITADGANFIQGFPYTFVSPTFETSTWQFGAGGELTTPGLGSISHRNNDLTLAVTGTDVIVLRTEGGDLVVNANGSLSFQSGSSIRVATAPAASTGVVGDKQGDVAFDSTYMYYCTADYPTTYEATLYGGYSGSAYPSIAKGNYPQPLPGWTFVWNLVTYTVVGATDPNPGEWSLEVDQTINTLGGGTITLTPPGGNIWRRVAWSADTW